jgi:glycosyltransferase involved in cell wall biosynthesis
VNQTKIEHFMTRIGIVAIGRNEGERLIRCLDSLRAQLSPEVPIVYVDSGSTDGSQIAATNRGVEVVTLDLSIPFTAARARNAGFQYLQQHHSIDYVQFVDGDCEVVAGWIDAAVQFLDCTPEAVAVCGWRRERYPDQSMFNRICDVEWRSGSVGEIGNFGGDVMMRAAALSAVGGYNDRVIAAEDDEVSVRLRQAGGKIYRIDQNSTLHDANIHHLSQWWQRAKRCGYAYGLVNSIHGAPPEQKFQREVRRTWIWGFLVPVLSLGAAWLTQGWSLLPLARYPITTLKVMVGSRRRGWSSADSWAWGWSCGVSVIPEALGLLKFQRDRWQNRQAEIIEYKGVQPVGSDVVQSPGR